MAEWKHPDGVIAQCNSAGFIALVVDTSDWKIQLGAVGSLIAAGVLYWLVRPDLGVD